MFMQYNFTKTGKTSSGGVVVSLDKVLQTMTCILSLAATNVAGRISQSVSSAPILVSLERMAPQAIKWIGSPENASAVRSSNVKSHCVSWEPFVPVDKTFEYSLALAPASTIVDINNQPMWLKGRKRFRDYEKKDNSGYFYDCVEQDLSPGTYAVFVMARDITTREQAFGRSKRVIVDNTPPVLKSLKVHRITPEAALLEGDVEDAVSGIKENGETYGVFVLGYSRSTNKGASGSAVSPKFLPVKSQDGVAQLSDLTQKAAARGVQAGVMVPVIRAQNTLSQEIEEVFYKRPIVIDPSGPGEGFVTGTWAASRPILHSFKCTELDLQINGLHDPESHVNKVQILVGKDEDDHSYHKSTLNEWASSVRVKLPISNLPSQEEIVFVTITGSTPNGHVTKYMQRVMIDCLPPRVPAQGYAVVGRDPSSNDTFVLEVAWEHAGDKSLNHAATSLLVLCGENDVIVHPRSTEYVTVSGDGSGTAAIPRLKLPSEAKCLVDVQFEDDGGQTSSLKIGFSVDFVKPDLTGVKIKFGESLYVNAYKGTERRVWPSATEMRGSFGPMPVDKTSLNRYECVLTSLVSLKQVATVSNSLAVDGATKKQSFVFAGLELVNGQSYTVTCTVLDNNMNSAKIVSDAFAIDSVPPTPVDQSLDVRSYMQNKEPCVEASWLSFESAGLGPKHYKACVQWQSGSDKEPVCSPNILHGKGDQVNHKACTSVGNVLKSKDVLITVTAYDHFGRTTTLTRSVGLASKLLGVVMPPAVWDVSRTTAFAASQAVSYRVNWDPLNANALSAVQQECALRIYRCGANECGERDVSKREAVATHNITKADLRTGYVVYSTAEFVDGGMYRGCLKCDNFQTKTVCTRGITVHQKPPNAGKLQLPVTNVGVKDTATLRVITPPSDSGSGLRSATVVVSNVLTLSEVARIPLATNIKKNTDVSVPVNKFGAGAYSFSIHVVNMLGMQTRTNIDSILTVDSSPPAMHRVHLESTVEKDGRIRVSVSCSLCNDPVCIVHCRCGTL